MSSQRKRREKVEKILQRIVGESSSGVIIIVEGKKDEAALRRLGVTGPIVCFKSSGKTLSDFLSGIHEEKTIVLTDFDKEGKNLSDRIVRELAHLKVRTDNVPRKQLGALTRQYVRSVEELSEFVEKMRAEELSVSHTKRRSRII